MLQILVPGCARVITALRGPVPVQEGIGIRVGLVLAGVYVFVLLSIHKHVCVVVWTAC